MTEAAARSKGRILVEGHNLSLASGTGIATYARELARGLSNIGYEPGLLVGGSQKFDPKDEMLAQISLFDPDTPPTLGQKIVKEIRKLTIGPFAARPFEMLSLDTIVKAESNRFAGFSEIHVVPHLIMREMETFRRFGRRLNVELQRPPRLFHATRPAPIKVKGCPNIYTLHDIVPLRLPNTTRDDKKLYLNVIRDLCNTADHIVTVSEFSRRDIIDLTGISEDRITNTYQAVSVPQHLVDRETSAVEHEIEALFGLSYGEYFLFVGALEPKKNVSRLIDAYAASGVKRPLVIAGSEGWMNEGEIKKIASERFLYYRVDGKRIRPERSIRRINYLPFEHLVSLMRGARALLFPSVYEGFGLPVLESMLLGTPVLTSNVSSLPEIAGDAALLINPYDIGAISDAIRALDADSDLCRELSEKGKVRSQEFSPAAYEARLTKLYDKLLG